MDTNKEYRQNRRRQEAILSRIEGLAAAERRRRQRVAGSLAACLVAAIVVALFLVAPPATRQESPQLAQVCQPQEGGEPTDSSPIPPASAASKQTIVPASKQTTSSASNPSAFVATFPTPESSAANPTLPPHPVAQPAYDSHTADCPASHPAAPAQGKQTQVISLPPTICIETNRLVYVDTPAPREPLLFNTEPMRNYLREQMRQEVQNLASL